MTTAEHARDISAPHAGTVSIAGVPWPRYKVVALVTAFLTFALVALVTSAAAPAVLTATGVATLIWVGGGVLDSVHG